MRTCFVVMGYGKKPDHEQGRVFDLDKSYQDIIKPAVQAAGCDCVRSDEIQHAGNINIPMYEQLLHADLVIADLSTANLNAFSSSASATRSSPGPRSSSLKRASRSPSTWGRSLSVSTSTLAPALITLRSNV